MPTYFPHPAQGEPAHRASADGKGSDPFRAPLTLQIVDPHSGDTDCMLLSRMSDGCGMISASHSLDTTPRTSVDLSSKLFTSKHQPGHSGVMHATGWEKHLMAAVPHDRPLRSLDELTAGPTSYTYGGSRWNADSLEPATPCKIQEQRTSNPVPKLQPKVVRKLNFDERKVALSGSSSRSLFPYSTHGARVCEPRPVAALPTPFAVQALPRKALSWRGRRNGEQRQCKPQGADGGVKGLEGPEGMDVDCEAQQPYTAARRVGPQNVTGEGVGPDTYDPMYPDTVRAGSLISGGSLGVLHQGVMHGLMVAVKVIRSNPHNSSASAVNKRKLEKEAATGLSLHHPHIIKTYCASMYAEATTDAYPIQPLAHAHYSGISSPNALTTVLNSLLGHAHHSGGPMGSCDPQYTKLGGGLPGPEGEHFAHIVMEWCPLGSLRQLLDARAATRSERGNHCLELDEVLPLAYEMAGAMAFMHSQGLVHGDFKAANILMKDVTEENPTMTHRKFTSKVIDFGNTRSILPDIGTQRCSESVVPPITPKANSHASSTGTYSSRSSDRSSTSSSSIYDPTYLSSLSPSLAHASTSASNSSLVGTPTHAAPELLMGNAPASPATDVYSLGVTLWELFTGGKPYSGYTLGDLLLAKKHPTSNMLLFTKAVPFLCQRLCISCWGPPATRPPMTQILSQLSNLCEIYASSGQCITVQVQDVMM